MKKLRAQTNKPDQILNRIADIAETKDHRESFPSAEAGGRVAVGPEVAAGARDRDAAVGEAEHQREHLPNPVQNIGQLVLCTAQGQCAPRSVAPKVCR